MDSTNPQLYLRRGRLPHPAPSHESHGTNLPAPHINMPQPGFYNVGPPPLRQHTGDLHQNPRGSPVGYSPVEMRYGSQNAPQSPSSLGGPPVQEHLGEQYGAQRISPTSNHLTAPGMVAPKRAYRQRRKDPSCDACRERKVKCDATETSSCSECLTRAVKCQFTKETNRRMSSIKQVQDLQNQLSDAKNTIGHLQELLQISPRHQDDSPQASSLKLPGVEHRVEPGLSPQLKGFAGIRKAVRKYSRGVFKVPLLYRQMAPTLVLNTAEIKLPPKHITDELLRQYYAYYNVHRPLLEWRSFIEQVEKAYEMDSLQGMPQVWVGMFFVILGCGSLQTSARDPEGLKHDRDPLQYMIIASRLLNTWTDNTSLDHARTSLMISIVVTELNIRSAAWIWLGSCLRLSQETGLHLTQGPWSKTESNARWMVYWAIFSWDRILSLDGRPVTFYEEDYEVPWPNPSTELPSHPLSSSSPPSSPITCTMPFVIPVIRFIPQLKKTLKSPTISRATLDTWDEYFQSIILSYPEILQPTSTQPLEPFLLHAVIPLQVARIVLYRHNLTTQCSTQERTEAIQNCLRAAYDTVSYIRRCMDSPPPSPEKRDGLKRSSKELHEKIREQADNFICKHIWRCTLFLSFKGDYAAALKCVELSAIIDDMRKMNSGCGRNLAYFLSQLLERVQAGTMNPHQLTLDEEMMAYASGDLQEEPASAWIWAYDEGQPPSGESGSATAAGATAGAAGGSSTTTTAASGNAADVPLTALLTEREMHDWGGWERVERLLRQLLEEQERQVGAQHAYHQPAHNSTKRVQLGLKDTSPAASSASPGPSVGASRISIANII